MKQKMTTMAAQERRIQGLHMLSEKVMKDVKETKQLITKLRGHVEDAVCSSPVSSPTCSDLSDDTTIPSSSPALSPSLSPSAECCSAEETAASPMCRNRHLRKELDEMRRELQDEMYRRETVERRIALLRRQAQTTGLV